SPGHRGDARSRRPDPGRGEGPGPDPAGRHRVARGPAGGVPARGQGGRARRGRGLQVGRRRPGEGAQPDRPGGDLFDRTRSAPQRPGPFRRPPRRGRDHLRSPLLSPPDPRRWTRHRSGDPPKGRPLRPLGAAGDAGARTEDRRGAGALEPPRGGNRGRAEGPGGHGLSKLMAPIRGGHGRRFVAGGLILAGVLLIGCPGAFALDPALDVSQYAHSAWRIREGFTRGPINALAQTPDGYLWLGTDFGLVRFHGVRTVPWQPPPAQRLPSNDVIRLLAARDGTLWIGTRGGLASWNAGTLTRYAELAGMNITALLEDHDGSVWAGTLAMPTARARPTWNLCAIRDGRVQCREEGSITGGGGYGLY